MEYAITVITSVFNYYQADTMHIIGLATWLISWWAAHLMAQNSKYAFKAHVLFSLANICLLTFNSYYQHYEMVAMAFTFLLTSIKGCFTYWPGRRFDATAMEAGSRLSFFPLQESNNPRDLFMLVEHQGDPGICDELSISVYRREETPEQCVATFLVGIDKNGYCRIMSTANGEGSEDFAIEVMPENTGHQAIARLQ